MRDNLGQVIRCVSHVTTRLRYVLKSEETTGSPRLVVITQSYSKRSEYVTSVSTDLNAPNGVFIKNDTESGADSTPKKENRYAVNVT